MYARGVQRFVAVDITDPYNDSLIEQYGLDLPAPAKQSSKDRRCRVERLYAQRSEPTSDVRLATGQTPHAAEATRIAKSQLALHSADRHTQMRMWLSQHIRIDNGQPTAHTQMNNQLGGRFETDNDPLRLSRDVDHTTLRQ